jgi:hypothetical protein
VDLMGQILSGIAVLAVGSLFAWIARASKRKVDTAKIISCLENDTYQFRTTHAIAANTNLTESRVRDLASASDHVRRNELEQESWALVGK